LEKNVLSEKFSTVLIEERKERKTKWRITRCISK